MTSAGSSELRDCWRVLSRGYALLKGENVGLEGLSMDGGFHLLPSSGKAPRLVTLTEGYVHLLVSARDHFGGDSDALTSNGQSVIDALKVSITI